MTVPQLVPEGPEETNWMAEVQCCSTVGHGDGKTGKQRKKNWFSVTLCQERRYQAANTASDSVRETKEFVDVINALNVMKYKLE